MPLEYARTQLVPKPWGRVDLRPWRERGVGGESVGEIWFERAGAARPRPDLLLKILFTSEPLSIQVHPDNAFAQSKGEANGKTEAWYVLAAEPGAMVALGLKASVSDLQLRAAIEDGSIADLVHWQPAVAGDVILVPAGTIHALGAGLVVAEIQQQSDTTYRLFDFGRGRALHVEEALAVARPGPAAAALAPSPLTKGRTLLVASPYFVLERIDLPAGTHWALNAAQETWLLVIQGQVEVGSATVPVGEAVFLDSATAGLAAGPDGMRGLLAYVAAAPVAGLLDALDAPAARGAPTLFTPPPHPALPASAAGNPELCP